jgi:D-alanyl-D-alanine carboxypeptidase (penicillin-binding protein 5/6)
MKKTLIALCLPLLATAAFATHTTAPVTTLNTHAKPLPVAHHSTAMTFDAHAAIPMPPLNKYGAVNVNANVPLSAQVPIKPLSLKLPTVTPIAGDWPSIIPTQPTLNVHSYLLMDAKTGTIIAAYNPHKRLAPASLTKLMLLYIVEQDIANGTLNLQSTVSVPTVAWATGGSRMFLKPKEQPTVRQLISGIIVDSGNDAAVTLATYLAGTQSSFVSLMNHQAQKIGMTNTHFTDIMGLPAPDHYSSAYDMSLLARAVVNGYPQYLSWFGQKNFTYNGIHQPNFNKLLFIYQYAQGLKTGSTNEAGFSLVSAAKKDGVQLIGVVMGAPNGNDSAQDSKALLTYGFRFFTNQTIYAAGQSIVNTKVLDGKKQNVSVGVAKDLTVVYPRALVSKLNGTLKINAHLTAPIKKGQVVGQVIVTVGKKLIATAPAVALQSVARGTFFERAGGKVKGWFS